MLQRVFYKYFFQDLLVYKMFDFRQFANENGILCILDEFFILFELWAHNNLYIVSMTSPSS